MTGGHFLCKQGSTPFMKQDAAVHEAGHVIAAYLVNFSCESVKVADNGNGQLIIDYGNLKQVAIVMMSMNICPEFRDFLHHQNKETLSDLANQLCVVLVAGGVAECVCNNGRDFCGLAQVELSGPDLIRAETISEFFNINLSQTIKDVYEFIKVDVVWKTVTALKEAILSSPNNYLDASDIYNVLQINDYLSFLEE